MDVHFTPAGAATRPMSRGLQDSIPHIPISSQPTLMRRLLSPEGGFGSVRTFIESALNTKAERRSGIAERF